MKRLPVVFVLSAVLTTGAAEPALAQASLGTLAQASVSDFRAFGSKDAATLLSIGAVAALVGHASDKQVTRQLSTPALAGTFRFGESLGGARAQLAAAVSTYVVGRVTDHERTAAIGMDLLRANLLTQAITAGIKTAAGRTRPDGTSYSFPSGHTSVSFAAATVLQRHLGWKAGAPAYGFAAYVAASRIQSRRHFLSDVVFGAALGIAAGRTVTIPVGDRKLAMAPAAAPGHASLNFTLVQ